MIPIERIGTESRNKRDSARAQGVDPSAASRHIGTPVGMTTIDGKAGSSIYLTSFDGCYPTEVICVEEGQEGAGEGGEIDFATEVGDGIEAGCYD